MKEFIVLPEECRRVISTETSAKLNLSEAAVEKGSHDALDIRLTITSRWTTL